MLAFPSYHLMDVTLQLHLYCMPNSIWRLHCRFSGAIRVRLKLPSFCWHNLLSPINMNFHCSRYYEYFVLLSYGILWSRFHPLWPLKTSTFSIFKRRHSSCKIASVHCQVLWGIDQTDCVGYQVERFHIMTGLLPLPSHQRQFLPEFSCHPWSSQELEQNSLPLFWSCPGSLFPARSCFSLNWVV